MGRSPLRVIAIGAVVSAPLGLVDAGVIEFTDHDAWFAAVGPVTTITFTEFPSGTFVTNEYLSKNVLFTDGLDQIICCDDFIFPNDGAGLFGVTSISLEFTTPQAWIAVDFPGFAQISLFSGGQLIHTSSTFGTEPTGNFAGLISTELFDAALISDPVGGDVFIDDLHFGVPAPGAAWLLVAAVVYSGARRRRSPWPR